MRSGEKDGVSQTNQNLIFVDGYRHIEAYVTITNYIRSLMFRREGYTRGAFSSGRQFGFGSLIGVVGMATAIIGAVWLGYTIAKQFKTHPKPRT